MSEEILQAEQEYRESLEQPLKQASAIGEADIVVGIPFYDEADTIGHVVEVAQEGLRIYYPDSKCVICCVGAPVGTKALEVVEHLPLPRGFSRIAFLQENQMVQGKGWALRSMMEIADRLDSDLVVLEADLLSREIENNLIGLSPRWINLLLEPLKREGFDLVLPRFNRHRLDNPVANHFLRPLMAALYHFDVREPLGGELAISSKFLQTCLAEPNICTNDVGCYGIDLWLIIEAITQRARIAETCLGVKLHNSSPGKQAIVLREQAKVMFNRVFLSQGYWKSEKEMVQALPSFGSPDGYQPTEVKLDQSIYVTRYEQGFKKFYSLYQEIIPEETFRELDKLAGNDWREFNLPAKIWSELVYNFMLAFCFDSQFTKGDILNAFIPLYAGRVAGFIKVLREAEGKLASIDPDWRERLLSLEAERELTEQVSQFVRQKSTFLNRWREKEAVAKPLLPHVTYREFIPGVPLILPREITSPSGEVVNTDSIYDAIHDRYQEEFEKFIYERLKIPDWTSSFELADSIRAFMRRIEKELNEHFPGNLHSAEGTQKVIQGIFTNFPHGDTFALKPEIASWLLSRIPPVSLLIKFGKASITELKEEYEPNEVLALSDYFEEREHREKIWNWLQENARPEHFTRLPLKPLVVNYDDFPFLAEMKEVSALSKLSGRIIICNLRKGIGGEFPMLRYFTMVAKNIVEAETTGEVWEQFASRRKEFGRKVINSLKGHWGREPLSAHNIFENKVQRILVERIKEMAGNLADKEGFLAFTRVLEDMADCYHLALTRPDGKFIPCSAWTWASYSFKGGKGFPTPLSLHVERDWASREFLTNLYQALGGTEEMLDKKIVELMGEGKEPENLAKILIPEIKGAEEVSPEWRVSMEEPRARELHRFERNPIFEAINKHPWESKYVFNAGAIRLRGKIYIIYRAMGEDLVSRLGLAVSNDGFHIEERLKTPIFEPKEEWEEKGCEDPRVVLIDNRIYMLYTAYSNIAAQIALASIDLSDFLEYRWERWERHGLLFPGFSNKDAILFPQKFNGQYALYHRIEPSIWVSFSKILGTPWSEEDHRILVGPRAGMIWDGVKVGAGAQPIKTKYGWLIIYHGVDFAHVYRLGVLVVDLKDPGKVLYRAPNFILEPKESCEIGEEGVCQVPNVVFTCGAAPLSDKDTLEDDDEIIVYYGAADTAVAAATAKISELIPKEVLVQSSG